MKFLFLLLTAFGSFFLCSGQTTLMATMTNNGIAPIPAFSLGKPAATVFLKTDITPNLEFSPDFAFNLEGKQGWFSDTWVKWKQPLGPAGRLLAVAGASWSTVFSDYGSNGSRITQSLSSVVFQGKLKFSASEGKHLALEYWYNHALDSRFGTKGSYMNFSYCQAQELGHIFEFEGKANLFWVDFSDGVSGTAIALESELKHQKTGIFIGVHILQPVTLHKEYDMSLFAGIARKLKS